MFGRVLHSIIHQNQDQLTDLLFVRIDLRTRRQFLSNHNIFLFGERAHNAYGLLCRGNEIHADWFELVRLRIASCDGEEIADELRHLLYLVAYILNNLLQEWR